MALYEPVFQALDRAGVRYVVVGGVAVVLQGYPRLTLDLDLVIDLEPAQARGAIQALLDLGLAPRAPVDAMDFADPDVRARWVEERNMQVFTLLDPVHPERAVDLFATEPIPFGELYERADRLWTGTTSARVASIEDLIAMKKEAGRPQDLIDVEVLERMRRERGAP